MGYFPTPRFRNLQARRQPTQAPKPTMPTVAAAVTTLDKSIVAIAVAISSIFLPLFFALFLPADATIDDSSNEGKSKDHPEDFHA